MMKNYTLWSTMMERMKKSASDNLTDTYATTLTAIQLDKSPDYQQDYNEQT